MTTKFPWKPAAVPLYYAARLGFRDLAEHLIAEHPEHVSAQGGHDETPMHAAAAAGHADILSILHEHGADLDGPLINGRSPLYWAFVHDKLEAGKRLLDLGADINISMLEESEQAVGLYYSKRRTSVKSSLLECY